MSRCYFSTATQPQVVSENPLETLCSSKYLGCESFVTFLGVIGALFTVADIFRIIRGGQVLDDETRRRKSSKDNLSTNEECTVNPAIKRDLKLISSVVGAEHYILLLVGSVLGRPTFLVPWLILQGFVIIMEILIFFVKLICGGVRLCKEEVIVYAFLVHNWLQVFCYLSNSAQ